MIDRAVMVPTSYGAIGGVISEPADEPRGTLLLLQGGGRCGRSGFNSIWARVARSLAGRGVTVLRCDFWGDGPMVAVGRPGPGPMPIAPRADRDFLPYREVISWFREHTGKDDLLLAGSCYGARVAIELAGAFPSVRATFLVVPYVRRPGKRLMWRDRLTKLRGGRLTLDDDRIDVGVLDPRAVEAFRAALAHGSSLVLNGARDPRDVQLLKDVLGHAAANLDVEIVAGHALYPVNAPDVQEIIEDRLTVWLDDQVGSEGSL